MLTAIVLILVIVCALWYGAQGLFTGLLHSVCCILAVLFAFALYEPLYRLVLSGYDTGLGLSLVLVFAAFLAGLKLLFDWAVPGDVTFGPPLAQKIAGGALSLPGGLIMAGVFLIALQMMPFGTAIGDYARFAPGQLMTADASNYPADPATLPLNPDGFTLGLVSLASNNGLGGTPIATQYGHLLNELFVTRDRVQHESRLYAPADGLRNAVVYQVTDRILVGSPSTQSASQPARPLVNMPKKLLVVRVQLGGKTVADTDGVIRFKLGQMRLLLSDGRFLRPIAITDSLTRSTQLKLARPNSSVKIKPAGTATLEFGFEDPGVSGAEEILGVEFKHTARSPLDTQSKINPLSNKDLGITEFSVQ